MDYAQVYAKTREGEEAVHQRTRLVQRNLRTVLILVDGKTSVKDLISKAGGEDVLVEALSQLERDGFIRLISGSSVAASVGKAASMDNFLEPATDESFPSLPPADTKSRSPFAVPQTDISVNPFAPPPVVAKVRASTASPPLDGVSISPFSIASPDKPVASAVNNPFQTASSPFAVPTPRPVIPTVTKVAALNEDGVEARRVEAPTPKVFKHRRKLITLPRLVVGFVGLVLVLALAAIFYPYNNNRSSVESALATLVGQPVSVGSITASVFPRPALVLSRVSIGAEADGIRISEVRAVPSFEVLIGKKSFSHVTLKGVQVSMAQIGRVASGLSAAGQSEVFSAARFGIEGMTMSARDISFDNYSGGAEFASSGVLKQLNLQSKDGSMKVLVGPGANPNDPTQVLVEGLGWKAGENSPFVFDSLMMSGQLSGAKFVAEKIEGRIFGGVVQGQLQMDWANGMVVVGDVNVDYMNAPQLVSALGGTSISVEGQASARIRFRASGASWNALADKVPLEGSFSAKSGAITGIDLVEAVRRGSKMATRGGVTRYDQFGGKFRWDNGALQLSDIELLSGPMRATGWVSVLKNNLSGSIAVVMQSSAATLRTPVAVVGTLKDPQLIGGRS